MYPLIGMSTSKKKVDKKILEVTRLSTNLYILKVPTFKPFTETLTNIAMAIPDARVIDISGQTEVQVRVKFDKDRNIMDTLKGEVVDGCTINFQYDMHMDLYNSRHQVNISLGSKTISLLNVLLWLNGLGGREIQVFDFFH